MARVHAIAARYPDRTVHVVGDAAYVGERLRDVDARITWTSRLKVSIAQRLVCLAWSVSWIATPKQRRIARCSSRPAAMELATQMADAFSSTAQDLNRHQPTEIDALNGYISRRGTELGIPVPVNHALFTLVKLAEQTGVT